MGLYREHVKPRLPEATQRALARARAELRGLWGRWRVQPGPTAALGPQFRRSRDLIELDVTWACNLRCYNCNRSCEQHPTTEHLTVDQVQRFLDECVAADKRWRQIRVLGGEPTLHPDLGGLLDALLAWRAAHAPDCRIVLVSNGHGDKVRERLAALPAGIEVEDTSKQSRVQPDFASFNIAPLDTPAYAAADFRNGCWVTTNCGVGLTPYGYYPCAVAGGIDRIVGLDLGRHALPDDDDDLSDQLDAFCRWCGHFQREPGERAETAVQSPAWQHAYARAKARPPRLTRY